MNLPLAVAGAAPPPVAGRQSGVFTRAQALDAGLSRRQIERRLASGAWQRLTHVALICADSTRVALTDAWAVGLTWPDAVASHWTAAVAHGFPLPAGIEGIDATTPRKLRSTTALRAHRLPLDEGDTIVLGGRGGPRVTTPERTAVDCLRVAGPDAGEQLLAWLVTRHVIGRQALSAEISRSTGRWGTTPLLELLRRSRTGALSAAERRLHAVLRSYGVTGWTANAEVRVGGRVIATVDLLFADARVVVEVDGWASHGGRDAFERDRQRQNALVNAGYTVLRFTWRDLTTREHQVVDEIRTAIDHRFSS